MNKLDEHIKQVFDEIKKTMPDLHHISLGYYEAHGGFSAHYLHFGGSGIKSLESCEAMAEYVSKVSGEREGWCLG